MEVTVSLPTPGTADMLGQGELILTEHITSTSHNTTHWHDSYEIGIVNRGSATLCIEDESYTLQHRQIYFIQDIRTHYLEVDDDSEVFVVHFHPAIIHDNHVSTLHRLAHIPFSASRDPLLPVDASISRRIDRLLRKLRCESKEGGAGWEIIASGLLIEISGYLARYMLKEHQDVRGDYEKQQQALKRVQPVLKLIEERYAENISLDELAAAAFVSPSHCCVLFQMALGSTPIAYRNNRRIAEAARLLRETSFTVREIAFQVGFGSVQALNRLFLRHQNMTPTQYRQHLQQQV